MLPVKIRIEGIGPYVDETVDFTEINGEVVAIVGENGAGKTMLVDSVFAALYRYMPSRDSIYRYCQEKAKLTLDFVVDGKNYRTTININAKKREMEPWLTEETEPSVYSPLSDGKNSTFDAEIERLCGPAEQILASVFMAQNKAGTFSGLPKAKRKELFIDMLGLGKLQTVSDEASIRERQVREEYDLTSSKVAQLKSMTEKKYDLDALHKKLQVVREEVSAAEADIKLETFEVGVLRSRVGAAKEITERQIPLNKRVQQVERDITETSRAIQTAERLAANLEKYRELSFGFESLSGMVKHLSSEKAELEIQQTDHYRRVATYTQKVRDLEHQKRKAQEIVTSLGLKLSRAGSDSAIISTVPCQGVGECADCQFLVNAVKARDAIADMEASLDNAQAQVLLLDAQIKETPAPENSRLEETMAQLENVAKQLVGCESKLAASNEAKSRLVESEQAERTMADLTGRLSRLRTDLQETNDQLAELEGSLKSAREAEADLKRAEAALDLNQEVLEGARNSLASVLAEVGRAEAEAEIASNAQKEIELLLPILEGKDRSRKSWNLLSKAFGKLGIQSLEIDAAGPAISEITNDLLFGCFGPRFSIRFVTQILKDDKSGYKDDFDIYVTDADSGREGSIDDLSGGQKVVVSEGVSLAISLFNRSRSNTGWVSLWRDEASSAVDDRRAPLYISMLRKARELGHFERLFFIAHQQRVTEAADSKIFVANGHISFE